MSQQLINAITEMQEEEAVALAQQMLDEGASPSAVLDACKQAMDVIGQRFEKGECFIPELILAGEMLSQVAKIVKPHIQQEAAEKKLGKVVVGTVAGDIHDIAKDIVVFMLDINGFEVTDLGVDVPVAKFVEAVQATGAKIVGLSGFLTLAYDPMKETTAAVKALDPEVKVMVGGGQIDEQIREYTGADAYGKDAMAAVAIAKGWA
ncbi:MAG TPA: cobalamin-dependent protein [Anaerolineales bacterium]|nr:cobalamin-dependent protein [Anaerolineales bacterium]